MKVNTADGWRPLADFSKIPAKTIASILIGSMQKLALKVGYVSVNLNRQQLLTSEINEALIYVQNLLRPLKLVVELTEEDNPVEINFEDLQQALVNYQLRGIELSLDDVGTGLNQLDNVDRFMPYLSELKFALQNFEESVFDQEIQDKIVFLRDLAQKNNLRFILEGIESEEEDQLLNKMNITLRQGYYYGKPHILKLLDDDPDN
ncbi:C-di-GMP-specific phosphodiesterase [Amylolactobacillus amylotrophicus DSM 20534]|nr:MULTISPECIES: EAL domain-containing protein [Amylolactobacillus]KRK38464.1 C-di-GMP-specific phosphodiesterase [Amylolactobacillus amylotrophicus DSM 20534]KRM42893.1 C-di-GMP-specific phosphodiesterase [Amylolactobacillus amylophilus DSM 20533 = JCM 1125]GED79758.1 diguanylate cyclase [Amylolactobacillus amylophilus]